MEITMCSSSSSSFPLLSSRWCECKPNLPYYQSPTLVSKIPTANDSLVVTPSVLPPHVKSITSTSNPFVKHCVKLRNSSAYRHSHASVLLVGATPIREMYKSEEKNGNRIECLVLHEKAEVDPEDLVERGVRIVRVNSVVMKKLCGVQSTESIDAVSLVKIPSGFHANHRHFSKWFPSAFRILVLDGIQDPGNLGNLLRSAVAFGWDGVFLLPGCCDPFNDKALRAGRGATFRLPMVSGQWSDLQSLVDGFQMKMLAGHPGEPSSCLTSEFARSLADTKVCLVLGSEGSGISEKAREASELVSIAMLGDSESLNVSVAGGIFLFMLQPQTDGVSLII